MSFVLGIDRHVSFVWEEKDTPTSFSWGETDTPMSFVLGESDIPVSYLFGDRQIHQYLLYWGEDTARSFSLRENPTRVVLRYLPREIQTHTQKTFKITLFIRTKHRMRIFRVIPFIKPQNDT